MKEEFIRALKNNDLNVMKTIPKSDLHNHSARGGNIKYIEDWIGKSIARPSDKFKNLHEMQLWNNKNINPLFRGLLGYEKRIEAAFAQAQNDGIKVLNMSIDADVIFHYGYQVEKLIDQLERLHHSFAPNVIFIPEIGFKTSTHIDIMCLLLELALSKKYFKSIDVYGNEPTIPTLKKVYRRAKEKGLILKAHVGEFGTADLVKKAVEELELDQVQHGIAAASSKSVMKWLNDNKIQLNVCPTSNVLLSRVEKYNVHPIRKLYDNGVKVTINTDDMLIFNKSVSEEFLNLYDAGVFNAVELNEIRLNGLADYLHV
ncbi:adenosine deaminase family protein [Clostridium zeae]|uniref:Adenosine deaminase family protein n=1 Tax=Clostridium zeae TaxID=2759022 RepID=A0ABQ1EE12_9CLOT|nr:adenosine deaminase [Clostridium zeae]GFZ32994.1 adenosine deaminase family protein [Clostridium zeae]